MSDTGKTYTEIEGRDSVLTVHDDHIVIKRSGFMAFFDMYAKTGRKEIPIREITRIESDHVYIRVRQRGYSGAGRLDRDLNTIQTSMGQDIDELTSRLREAISERKQALGEIE